MVVEIPNQVSQVLERYVYAEVILKLYEDLAKSIEPYVHANSAEVLPRDIRNLTDNNSSIIAHSYLTGGYTDTAELVDEMVTRIRDAVKWQSHHNRHWIPTQD